MFEHEPHVERGLLVGAAAVVVAKSSGERNPEPARPALLGAPFIAIVRRLLDPVTPVEPPSMGRCGVPHVVGHVPVVGHGTIIPRMLGRAAFIRRERPIQSAGSW
jgi:hypothetical protein